MLTVVTTLRCELSNRPVPDWQRQRDRRSDTGVVLHQPFEAPYRSLIRAEKSMQPAARRWAKLAIEILETNRVRFGSTAMRQKGDTKSLSPVSLSTPPWAVTAVELPSFSAASVERWIAAINVMIQEQLPYFQLHQDWSSGGHGCAGISDAKVQVLDEIDREVRRLAGCTESR